ncbi:unnamed protein product [Gordionus sp. m RMFG-2023]
MKDFLDTILTLIGDYNDPSLNIHVDSLILKLVKILSIGKNEFRVKTLEPWNSVRLTFNIPRNAAIKLRNIASSQQREQLQELGILSVQIQGDTSSIPVCTAYTISKGAVISEATNNNVCIAQHLVQNKNTYNDIKYNNFITTPTKLITDSDINFVKRVYAQDSINLDRKIEYVTQNVSKGVLQNFQLAGPSHLHDNATFELIKHNQKFQKYNSVLNENSKTYPLTNSTQSSFNSYNDHKILENIKQHNIYSSSYMGNILDNMNVDSKYIMDTVVDLSQIKDLKELEPADIIKEVGPICTNYYENLEYGDNTNIQNFCNINNNDINLYIQNNKLEGNRFNNIYQNNYKSNNFSQIHPLYNRPYSFNQNTPTKLNATLKENLELNYKNPYLHDRIRDSQSFFPENNLLNSQNNFITGEPNFESDLTMQNTLLHANRQHPMIPFQPVLLDKSQPFKRLKMDPDYKSHPPTYPINNTPSISRNYSPNFNSATFKSNFVPNNNPFDPNKSSQFKNYSSLPNNRLSLYNYDYHQYRDHNIINHPKSGLNLPIAPSKIPSLPSPNFSSKSFNYGHSSPSFHNQGTYSTAPDPVLSSPLLVNLLQKNVNNHINPTICSAHSPSPLSNFFPRMNNSSNNLSGTTDPRHEYLPNYNNQAVSTSYIKPSLLESLNHFQASLKNAANYEIITPTCSSILNTSFSNNFADNINPIITKSLVNTLDPDIYSNYARKPVTDNYTYVLHNNPLTSTFNNNFFNNLPLGSNAFNTFNNNSFNSPTPIDVNGNNANYNKIDNGQFYRMDHHSLSPHSMSMADKATIIEAHSTLNSSSLGGKKRKKIKNSSTTNVSNFPLVLINSIPSDGASKLSSTPLIYSTGASFTNSKLYNPNFLKPNIPDNSNIINNNNVNAQPPPMISIIDLLSLQPSKSVSELLSYNSPINPANQTNVLVNSNPNPTITNFSNPPYSINTITKENKHGKGLATASIATSLSITEIVSRNLAAIKNAMLKNAKSALTPISSSSQLSSLTTPISNCNINNGHHLANDVASLLNTSSSHNSVTNYYGGSVKQNNNNGNKTVTPSKSSNHHNPKNKGASGNLNNYSGNLSNYHLTPINSHIDDMHAINVNLGELQFMQNSSHIANPSSISKNTEQLNSPNIINKSLVTSNLPQPITEKGSQKSSSKESSYYKISNNPLVNDASTKIINNMIMEKPPTSHKKKSPHTSTEKRHKRVKQSQSSSIISRSNSYSSYSTHKASLAESINMNNIFDSVLMTASSYPSHPNLLVNPSKSYNPITNIIQDSSTTLETCHNTLTFGAKIDDTSLDLNKTTEIYNYIDIDSTNSAVNQTIVGLKGSSASLTDLLNVNITPCNSLTNNSNPNLLNNNYNDRKRDENYNGNNINDSLTSLVEKEPFYLHSSHSLYTSTNHHQTWCEPSLFMNNVALDKSPLVNQHNHNFHTNRFAPDNFLASQLPSQPSYHQNSIETMEFNPYGNAYPPSYNSYNTYNSYPSAHQNYHHNPPISSGGLQLNSYYINNTFSNFNNFHNNAAPINNAHYSNNLNNVNSPSQLLTHNNMNNYNNNSNSNPGTGGGSIFEEDDNYLMTMEDGAGLIDTAATFVDNEDIQIMSDRKQQLKQRLFNSNGPAGNIGMNDTV